MSFNVLFTYLHHTQVYVFFHLIYYSLQNTTFRKLDLFLSSGEGEGEDTYSVGAQLSRFLLPHLHLRTKRDPVSETSCSLEYQTMEKVQNPSNSVLYTIVRTI
jgi:hypothetical protein